MPTRMRRPRARAHGREWSHSSARKPIRIVRINCTDTHVHTRERPSAPRNPEHSFMNRNGGGGVHHICISARCPSTGECTFQTHVQVYTNVCIGSRRPPTDTHISNTKSLAQRDRVCVCVRACGWFSCVYVCWSGALCITPMGMICFSTMRVRVCVCVRVFALIIIRGDARPAQAQVWRLHVYARKHLMRMRRVG